MVLYDIIAAIVMFTVCCCLCPQYDIEAVDPRGRTPLHLAVSLGHLELVRVLLRHGASVTKENAKNWTG